MKSHFTSCIYRISDISQGPLINTSGAADFVLTQSDDGENVKTSDY